MAAALLVLATGLGVRFRAKKNNNVAARSAANFPEAEGFDEEEAPVKLRGRRLLEFEKIPDAFDSADQISTTGNEDAIIVLRVRSNSVFWVADDILFCGTKSS